MNNVNFTIEIRNRWIQRIISFLWTMCQSSLTCYYLRLYISPRIPSCFETGAISLVPLSGWSCRTAWQDINFLHLVISKSEQKICFFTVCTEASTNDRNQGWNIISNDAPQTQITWRIMFRDSKGNSDIWTIFSLDRPLLAAEDACLDKWLCLSRLRAVSAGTGVLLVPKLEWDNALTTEDRSSMSSSDIQPHRRSGSATVWMSCIVEGLEDFAAKSFFNLSSPDAGLWVGCSFCRQGFLSNANNPRLLFLLSHDTPLSIFSL